MNLKPRVSSNRFAAFTSPTFPSLIRSGRLSPRFWYCFATDTTKRRLASTIFFNADSSPARIFTVKITSSSADIMLCLEISSKYRSSEESRLVIDLLMTSWRMVRKCKPGKFPGLLFRHVLHSRHSILFCRVVLQKPLHRSLLLLRASRWSEQKCPRHRPRAE